MLRQRPVLMLALPVAIAAVCGAATASFAAETFPEVPGADAAQLLRAHGAAAAIPMPRPAGPDALSFHAAQIAQIARIALDIQGARDRFPAAGFHAGFPYLDDVHYAPQPFSVPGRVWIRGHYEEQVRVVTIPAVVERRLIPAVTERVWIPEVCEDVRIPAVIEKVWCPPVCERVWQAPVCERVWCPPVCERVWCPAVYEDVCVPAVYETVYDSLGRPHRFCVRPARVERRLVCDGRFEMRETQPGRYVEKEIRPGCWVEREVKAGCYVEKVVVPERCERRVVRPGCYETRIVQAECWRDVVVCAERREKVVERVYVPGRWAEPECAAPSVPPRPPAHGR